MSKRTTARSGAAAVASMGAVIAMTLGTVAPAHADVAPQKKDVVGVGSDAVQNAVDFLADGLTLNGKSYTGYNETKGAAKWRLFNFDASGDANGTATSGATAVLQAGTSPVQLPYGGSQGLAALEADGSGGKSAGLIDFARNPSAPTATDEQTALANLGTTLDTVTIAKDFQYVATTSTTNAPSVLSAADLFAIYTGKVKTWGDLATFDTSLAAAPISWTPAAGTAGNKILAFYPQNGAGMQKIFLNGLASANGGKAPAATDLTNGVQVKQNDPTTLLDPSTISGAGYTKAQAADVIVPIPQSKYNLFTAGYFLDGTKPYNAATTPPAVGTTGWKLETGTGSFKSEVDFDIIFRHTDLTTKTAWQPGSKLNWVQSLFYNTNPYASPDYKPTKAQAKKHPKVTVPYVFSATGQSILKALGLTPVPYAQAFTAGSVG